MKFLIIDDNAQWRRFVTQTLNGHACAECPDGIGALEAYQQHLPDWVLMDFEMPLMDGLTAARQIKSHFPDARIAILSQHSDPELWRAAAEAKVDRYIAKDELWRIEDIALGHAQE